jgi:glucosamine-6-phosphate deaminase
MTLPDLRVTVYPDAQTAARAVAARLAKRLQDKPDMVFGLATGRTPIALYEELGRLTASRGLDWSKVTTFNLDEFVGVHPEAPGSYRRFMEEHLFRFTNIRPERINFLVGTADPDEEYERYERAILQAGGIDVQILGIGTNGHIGFNEPAPGLEARTHRVTLKAETRRSNAALFGGQVDQVPTEALSMGMATILQARQLILLAHGESKAHCIAEVVHGPLTTELPASFLQLHHDADLILDTAAARGLTLTREKAEGKREKS